MHILAHPGDTAWETILAEPASLAEVVIFGNGKDCDLTISLLGGRHFLMTVDHVTVSADSMVTAEFKQVDDLNVKIRYSGPDLEARSVRIGYDDPDLAEEFRESVRKWLSCDQDGEYDEENNELRWCVDAEIVLTSSRQHADAATTRPTQAALQ